ncbi:MAG TPA: hypothetical protein GX745_06985 [Clostridiales bacterium]|nr:hypothetical protein [Clostridiales bacterium]
MKKSFWQSFRVGMLIVATIVGAGFASGRELITFFGKFGYASIPIAALCAVLLFLSLALFMSAGAIIRPNSIEEFNRAVFGRFAPVIDFVLLFNYLIILATMLAGSDSLFEISLFNNNLPVVSILTAILTFIIIYKGFETMLDVNAVLVPVILYMALIISVFSLAHPVPYEMDYSSDIGMVIFFVAIYVSMNIMLSVGVITTIKLPLKEQIKGATTGSLVIGFFIAILTAAIMRAGLNVYNSQMPVMEIAARMNMSFVAGIIIWAGIFTTILTAVYTINSWTQSFIKNKALSITVILITGLIISRLGFKNIVDSFYPISGVIGLVYIFWVLIFYIKAKKRLKKAKNPK